MGEIVKAADSKPTVFSWGEGIADLRYFSNHILTDDELEAWKAQTEHLVAQWRGQRDWYQRYEVRVARVERAYGSSEPSR